MCPQTSKNQIKVDLVDENFTELRGEIAGPPDTPYEGIEPELHGQRSPPRHFDIHVSHPETCCALVSEVADFNLKLKSQRRIRLTLQRYVSHRTLLLYVSPLTSTCTPVTRRWQLRYFSYSDGACKHLLTGSPSVVCCVHKVCPLLWLHESIHFVF